MLLQLENNNYLKIKLNIMYMLALLEVKFIMIRGMMGNTHVGIYNTFKGLYYLKVMKSFKYNQLMDIVCIDLLGLVSDVKRFELVYVLLNLNTNKRMFIHKYVQLFEIVKSVINIYESADWLEREVYDMFGIIFKNHPDLRRILSDYGFKGHAGRKDFPLTGYTELRYDDSYESIVSDPLELTQEYRFFKLEDSWSLWNVKLKKNI